MEYHVCSIKNTWLFVFSFLNLKLADAIVYEKAISLINWIMQVYSKQNFASEELIYADYIILCK